MAHFDPSNRLRPDLLKLLESYAQFGDVVLVSASPGLRWHWNTMRKLKRCCRAILIRRNEGYDFGSWMAALHWLKRDLQLSINSFSQTTAFGDQSHPSTIYFND